MAALTKRIFEYAIIKQGKNDKEGNILEDAKLLVEPVRVLAQDIDTATLLAARQIPEDELTDIERIEVAVRPF